MEQASITAAIAATLSLSASANAQSFDGNGTVVSGTASIGTGPGTTNVLIGSPEVVINWQPSKAGGTDPLNFQPSGTTANFIANPQFSITDFTVLNRILPVDSATGLAINQPIAFNGTVNSLFGQTVGGNIWFYSPGGIIVGATGVFNAGGLVLTSNDVDTTGGLYGAGSAIRFGVGTPRTNVAVDINAGAQINAGSYLAVVAPRIVQAGTVRVDGATAYVAADRASIAINAGLFDIAIGTGTSDANGIVHSGTTTGPATTGPADAQHVYLVGMAKNDALTMLLSGTIGFTPATTAANEAGAVILSAGGGVSAGDVVAPTSPTTRSGAAITNANFLSRLTGYATSDISVSPGTGQGVTFGAGADLTSRTRIDLIASAGGQIASNGTIALTTGTGAQGGTINVSAVGGQSSIIAAGDLILSATGSDPSLVAPANGANNSGGTVNLLADGGRIVANSLNVNVSATAGVGTQRDGSATGGVATLAAQAGGSATFAATTLRADAGPPTSRPSSNANTGADTTGGRIGVTASGGTLALGTPVFSATSTAGFGTVQGGASIGGSISINVTNANVAWNTLLATVDSRTNGADLGGTFGSVTPSTGGIQLDVGANGTLAIAGTLDLRANADAAGGNGNGAIVRAGSIGIAARDGGQLSSAALSVSANATGDKADQSALTGAPHLATGGTISIGAAGGRITTAALQASATGQTSGSGPTPGLAQGGNVSLFASRGGSLATTTVGGVLSIDASGNGGAGSSLNGRGGTVLLHADDGTVSFAGPMFVTADGSGTDSFYTGIAGGFGAGGTITIETRPGTLGTARLQFDTLRASVDGFETNFGEGLGGSFGPGGITTGGTLRFNLGAGTTSANSLVGSANAIGGNANSGYDGGNATGGDIALNLAGGAATITTLALTANGSGGSTDANGNAQLPQNRAGTGRGGTVSVIGTGGTLTTTSVALAANGTGGAGRLTTGAAPPIGGDGIGGTALVQSAATSTAQFLLGTLDVRAEGRGGVGGEFAPNASLPIAGINGGVGGNGTGGNASVRMESGTLNAAQLLVSSDGFGANGGNDGSGTGTGGRAGNGRGGLTDVSFGAGATLDLSTITASANGLGASGGRSARQGGSGGDGTGGITQVTIGVDPTFASLDIMATGQGGVGGLGDIGGSGGNATAGNAALLANSDALVVQGALRVRAGASGGAGASGATGPGGAGGSATGGTARLLATGPTVTVNVGQLDIDASVTGGNGGSGTGNSNGGAASAGAASLSVLDNAALSFDSDATIRADATGGNGFGNGAGGAATGGTARIDVNSAALRFAPAQNQGTGLLTISSAASGGSGGGTGTGGTASLTGTNATLALADLQINATGSGGAGTVGRGIGGAALLSVADTTATPTQQLGTVTLTASGLNGTGAILPAVGGLAGVTSDAAHLAIRGDLVLDVLGAPSAANGGVFFDGRANPTLVGGNALFTSGGDARLSVSGAGTLAIGGRWQVRSRTIAANHLGQSVANPLASATAQSITWTATTAITGNGATLLRAVGTIDVNAGGAATIGALIAGGNITVNSVGDLTGGNATSTGGSINWQSQAGNLASGALTAGGVIMLRGAILTSGSLSAGSYIDIVGSGTVATGAVNAGTDVVITANGGNLSTANVTAGDDIWLTAPIANAATSVTTGTLTSTGLGSDTAITNPVVFAAINGSAGPTANLVRVLSGGSVTTGAITASTGRAILVSQQGPLTTGDLAARDGLALLASGNVRAGAVTNPGLLIVGDAARYSGPLLTGFDVATLASQPRARTAGSLQFDGPVSTGTLIGTTGGPVTFSTITTGGTIELDATGGIIGTGLTSGGNAVLTGNGGITLRDLVVTGNATLTAPGNALSIARNIAATGNITATAGSIALNALGNLRLTRADATTGSLTVNTGGDVAFVAGSAATNATLSSGGSLSITALTAGGSITAAGTSPVTVTTATAGTAIQVTGGSSVTSSAIQAGTNITITATGGPLSVVGSTAGGAVTLNGGGALVTVSDITARGGAITISGTGAGGALSATRLNARDAITVAGASPVTLTTATAGTAIQVTSGTGTVTGNDLVGTDITLASSSGATTATGVTASGALSLQSQTGTASGSALSGRTINLSAGSDGTVDTATATAGLTISSGGSARLIGNLLASSITIGSRDIAIATGAAIGSEGTTDTITLSSLDTGSPAIIGGDGTGAGYNLSAVEAGRLFARNITISAAGSTGGIEGNAPGGGSLIVRDLALAAGPQANLATTGTLALTAGGTIRVEGAVGLTGLAPTGSLSLDAGQSVSVISGRGSIDLRDAGGALGGSLSISAGSVYAATDAAIADVDAANSIVARTVRLAANDGVVIEQGLLRAGAIRLAGPNGIFIQNTGATSAINLRRGFTANTIDLVTNPTTQIVINGRLTNPATTNGFFTGTSTIARLGINGSAGGLPGGFDPLSTANGCIILNIASCSGSSDLMPNSDRLQGTLDPLAGYRTSLSPPSLLSFMPSLRNGYPPLIDEPITGVGNEDLWTIEPPASDPAAEEDPK